MAKNKISNSGQTAEQKFGNQRKRLLNIAYPDGTGIRELPKRSAETKKKDALKAMRQLQIAQYEKAFNNRTDKQKKNTSR